MSDWTVDTLKEYVETMSAACRRHTDDKFEAQEEATHRALASAQLAVDKAERLAELRAETQDRLAAERAKAQNEWRDSLKDMTGTYMTQVQYEAAHTVLTDKIDALDKRVSRAEGGRSVGTTVVPWVISVVVGLIAFAALIINIIGHIKF